MTTVRKGVTEKLAEYISNLKYDNLPADVVQQAKKVILDALGCQVACSLLENGRLIIQFGRAMGGQAQASVFGSDYKTSAVNAALINGTLGHGDEIDEAFGEVGHVAAITIPVAFACGEKERASGKDMIVAVVAGYDMAGHLAKAGVSIDKLTLGYSDGYASVFWGVATACSILKLKTRETRIALGLAACQSGGFFDFTENEHMSKSLIHGIGARNGATAALLAQMGFGGPLSTFEGDLNVLKYQVGENYNHEALIADLGKKFEIMDTSIKMYAAGHPIHAPAHGLLKILESENIDAKDIRLITVRQPRFEHLVVNNRNMPSITIQYCLAVAAFDRQLTWDQFTPEKLADPQIADLRNRVVSIHDPKMDKRKEITKAQSAEVDVETCDGRRFSERVDYPPGFPKNPLSQADVDKKVMHYASKVLGKERAQSLIETVKDLEAVSDLNELGNMLRVQH